MDPLDDISVIELTQMLAGSFAGLTLAEYGANVVKVERPGYGEIARHVEPSVGGESFYYMSLNRGKQSLTIDLNHDDGLSIFFDLVEEADVIIENFAPGTVERLGVDYESVRVRNPEIIYCSISAFGQNGPKSSMAGVDYILQAYSGVASMTRGADGRPLRSGMTVADLAGASYATNAILASIRRRDRENVGDYLDVALSDALLSFLNIRTGYSFATGEAFPDIGRAHVYFVPEGIFETADGYVQVSVITERHWERLCEALDAPSIRDDTRYSTLEARREHRDQLLDRLEHIFQGKSTDEWVDQLLKHDVPVQEINDTLSVWDDPHTQAREMRFDVETPKGDSFPTVSYPVKHRTWEWTGDEYIAKAGGDSEAILRRLGYSDESISQFKAAGVI